MPADDWLTIPQAILLTGKSGPTVAARSEDFPPAWEDAARTAVLRFGQPADASCPNALFAVPVGRGHVAVVQVTTTHSDLLGFHFLILTRRLYEALGGDPFLVADRFPPNWSARGELPLLKWPMEAPPRRTVEDVQRVLKTGDSPLLLGAAQALLDGGRVAVPATDPAATQFIRDVWTLLPDRTRCELWPATFAFSTELGFHAVTVPASAGPDDYLTPDQCRDYPEGRYELALQIAAESGDQAELDRLFARRSSADTLKLAIGLLVAAVVLAVVSKLIS